MGNESSRRKKLIIDQPLSNNRTQSSLYCGCNRENGGAKKYFSLQKRIYDAFRFLPDAKERGDLELKSFKTVQQYQESEYQEGMKKIYGSQIEKGEDPWESDILPYNSKFTTIKEHEEQEIKEVEIAEKKLEEQKRLDRELFLGSNKSEMNPHNLEAVNVTSFVQNEQQKNERIGEYHLEKENVSTSITENRLEGRLRVSSDLDDNEESTSISSNLYENSLSISLDNDENEERMRTSLFEERMRIYLNEERMRINLYEERMRIHYFEQRMRIYFYEGFLDEDSLYEESLYDEKLYEESLHDESLTASSTQEEYEESLSVSLSEEEYKERLRLLWQLKKNQKLNELMSK